MTSIIVTDAAKGKIAQLLREEDQKDLFLRIAVQPGGCAGLQYQLFFDNRSLPGDLKKQFDSFDLVVDEASTPYIDNSVVDFTDSIKQTGFVINNPNATSSCACGNSFCS